MSPVNSKETLKEFLDRKFLDWQRDERERKTLAQFSEWLEVSPNTLNNWLRRDKLPKGANIELLASKLGPEIYDALGIPRPDPVLTGIIQNWYAIPARKRRELAEQVGQYVAKTAPVASGAETQDEAGMGLLPTATDLVEDVLEDFIAKLVTRFGDQIDPAELEKFKVDFEAERSRRREKKRKRGRATSGGTGPLSSAESG